jgi:hypothetical protein
MRVRRPCRNTQGQSTSCGQGSRPVTTEAMLAASLLSTLEQKPGLWLEMYTHTANSKKKYGYRCAFITVVAWRSAIG